VTLVQEIRSVPPVLAPVLRSQLLAMSIERPRLHAVPYPSRIGRTLALPSFCLYMNL